MYKKRVRAAVNAMHHFGLYLLVCAAKLDRKLYTLSSERRKKPSNDKENEN
jgi:hypothetical protein